MQFLNLVAVTAIAATAFAAPNPHRLVTHEKREFLPKAWSFHEKAPALMELPMRIGLTQSNLDKGHDLLMEVSSHDSPKFAQYYTEEQIHDLFAPATEAVDAVKQWLHSAGIHPSRISQSYNKQWIQFDAPVEEAEKLLNTEYHIYQHGRTGKMNIGCEHYQVPEAIQEHVDYITPGIKLHAPSELRRSAPSLEKRTFGVTGGIKPIPPLKNPLPVAMDSLTSPVDLALCDVAITPPCIKALYNITAPTTKHPGNEMGIFEDLGDVYSQEDLNEFFLTLAPNIPQGTHPTLHAIDGAVAPDPVSSAGAESDLDFQISYPIIYPQELILFQTDDPVYEANYTYPGFLNNFLDGIDGSYCTYSAFGETGNSPLDPKYPDPQAGGYKGQLQCGKYSPTNVISISYGGQEQDLPMSYQRRQCNEFMKLGMQGTTVVISSGDSGVAGPAGDDNSDGCLGKNGKIFSPDFPATCPYVTALGATYLPVGGDATKDQEVAVTRFPSGGGFSNIYPIPSYQQKQVANYFATAAPPYKYYESTYNSSFGKNGGIYNRAGRGYPDFSAVGDNVVIFNQGSATLIGGTSASAPTFASIITRINEARLLHGKKTVGFVNPTLYANPQVLHDITVGSNPGCGTNGFNVSKGWDPVTGVGTPNFAKMLELYLSLP